MPLNRGDPTDHADIAGVASRQAEGGSADRAQRDEVCVHIKAVQRARDLQGLFEIEQTV